jgi:hypothetical protein
LSLGSAATRELRPVHRLVAGLPVGQADQMYDMTQSTPLGRCPAGLKIGIVRMRTNNEDAQGSICHANGSS